MKLYVHFKSINLKRFLKLISLFFLTYISICFIFFNIWLKRYFGDVDFDLLLININFGFNGLLNADDYVINKLIQYCIYAPIISSLLILLLKILILKKEIFSLKVFLLNILFFFLIIFVFLDKKDFFYVLKNNKNNNFIELNYVQPELTKKFDNIKRKDLVIIYLESFEENYINNPVFDQKIISKLNMKNLNAQKIPNFVETKYNNYTIGGIVSSQCGIPQKPIGIFDPRLIYNKNISKHQTNVFGLNVFLPNAICLGDILKSHQYENKLIYSGHMNFHSMDIFFKTHGYDKFLDFNYFDKFKNIKKNSWSNGVNDSTLFEHAVVEIEQFKKIKKNFNLTILTTDTHFPGYKDENCNNINHNEDQLVNSIQCTTLAVHNFVEKLVNLYGNTISIIILGDHLYPIDDKYNNHKNTKAVNKDKNNDRYIYGRIIAEKKIINRSKMTHYDFFPSILQSINLDYGTKLGLGYSIFDPVDNSSYEKYFNNLIKNIRDVSKYYYNFWK